MQNIIGVQSQMAVTWGRLAPFWSLFLLPNQRLWAPRSEPRCEGGRAARRGCGWWAGAGPGHPKPQAGALGPMIRGAPGAGGASLAAEPLGCAGAGPVANPRQEAGQPGRARTRAGA